jgi:predicted O-methyltransferase YrrM
MSGVFFARDRPQFLGKTLRNMNRFKHITPKYVSDRLAQMSFQRRNPTAPWIAATMVTILDQWLRPSDSGIEWGSGRSTLWLAQRVGSLHSIEENAGWHARVTELLDGGGLRGKVDLQHLPIGDEDSSVAPYVIAANRFQSGSLDFALVDGALRDHCASAAIRLLKPGGILIIDNVERYLPQKRPTRSPGARSVADGYCSPLWADIGGKLSSWRSIWATDGVSDTALWVKP